MHVFSVASFPDLMQNGGKGHLPKQTSLFWNSLTTRVHSLLNQSGDSYGIKGSSRPPCTKTLVIRLHKVDTD